MGIIFFQTNGSVKVWTDLLTGMEESDYLASQIYSPKGHSRDELPAPYKWHLDVGM